MSEDGKQVDYRQIKKSPLLAEYKKEAKLLQRVDLESLSELEKKVFFVSILVWCLYLISQDCIL